MTRYLLLALLLLAGPAAAQITGAGTIYVPNSAIGIIPVARGGTGMTATSAVSTAQLDKISNVTLASVAGLSLVLPAIGSYECSGGLSSTIGAAAGGAKMALSSGDSLVVSSMRLSILIPTTGLVTATALGSTIGAASLNVGYMGWSAGLVVTTPGTLVVQAAQQVSDPATTSFLVNSTMRCARVS